MNSSELAVLSWPGERAPFLAAQHGGAPETVPAPVRRTQPASIKLRPGGAAGKPGACAGADQCKVCPPGAGTAPRTSARNIIGEPLRRDTAAAVALAALILKKRFGNPVMCVLTADHLISPEEEFRAELTSAARAAETEAVLYTFGIPPTYPATCYGYLERGEKVHGRQRDRTFPPGAVQGKTRPRHRRKLRELRPVPVEQRDVCLAGGDYPDRAETSAPRAPEPARTGGGAGGRTGLGGKTRPGFRAAQSYLDRFRGNGRRRTGESGSRALRWNDVGGWLALEEFLEKDAAGNVHRGGLETLDAEGNLTFCEDQSESVALVGVRDLVVVRAGKRTLVVPKTRAEEIKTLVQRLNRKT